MATPAFATAYGWTGKARDALSPRTEPMLTIEPPPVTMATLSASRIEVSSLCSNDRGGGCVPHPAHRPPRDGRVAGEPAERAAIFRQQVGAELTNASL